MNNVQHLLDTLGPPPAEVCLDWAWQLVGLADQSRSPGCASWSSLLIDQSGQLSFTDPSKTDSEVQSIAELVQQLLDWSGKEEARSGLLEPHNTEQAGPTKLKNLSMDLPAVSLPEHRRSLSQLVLVMQSDDEYARVEAPAAGTMDEFVGEAANKDVDEAALDSTELLAEPRSNSNLDTEPAIASDAFPRVKNPRIQKRPSPVMLWSGAALGLATVVSLLMFLWPSGHSERGSTSGFGSSSVAAQPADSTANKKSKQKSPAGKVQSLDESVSPAELAVAASSNDGLTTLQPTQEQTPPLGVSEVTMNSFSSAMPADSLSSLSSRTPTLELPKSESVEQGADATASPQDSVATSPKSSDNAAPPEDVASMLAAAAKAEPKVSNVEADVGDSGIPKLPVQFLDIDSMLQVQEISAKIRVRQPVWQLRIASTEAFSVDPPGMQSLAEKQTVRWSLTAKELKTRKDQEPTQVVVFAQLAGRRADIKWKIAAGGADLPAIVVPLNEELLDVMLNMLQAYQQRLTSGVASIKDSLELPGIPREQRSLLAAQRKAMENEGKLVTRARQIIADAGMFVSWLDRSIEMHGNLTDQLGGQSVTMLQIGQPEPPKVEALPDNNEPAEHGQ